MLTHWNKTMNRRAGNFLHTDDNELHELEMQISEGLAELEEML